MPTTPAYAVLFAIVVIAAGCTGVSDGAGGPSPDTTEPSPGPDVTTTHPPTVPSSPEPTAGGPGAELTPSPEPTPTLSPTHEAPPSLTASPGTPSRADQFPVPAGARPTFSPDPDPPVSPDTVIQAFEVSMDPAAATAWYRDGPDGWRVEYVTEGYNLGWGWLNRLALSREDELLAIWIAAAPNGSQITLSRGTGVVAAGDRAVIGELGFEATQFVVAPMALDAIDHVTPLGGLSPAGHTLPTDHSYLAVTGDDRPSSVYAPANGIITSVGYHRLGDPPVDDFDLVIVHTNTLVTKFGHMAALDPDLEARLGDLELGFQEAFVRVEAGDRLGTAPSRYSTSLDWWVYDADRTLTGFATPAYYGRSVHAMSFLDYLTPELRAAFEPRFVRDEAPIGGRIDYDTPGRIVGAWFLDAEPFRIDVGERQLSFVYSVHDPDTLRVAVGGTVLETGLYAVVDDTPDPATVGAADGPVAYRLQRVTGTGHVRPGIVGTLLVELLEDDQLRAEGFEGDVEDPTFSDAALTYTR